eukprot:TRINITY_DN5252_c0_g1_i10.p4 TRINITY_DN5252_c0_g1~~TRINITY_DN5252_c0_g1_i10.p4  ORF type:complete len:102 (-),score=14.36 TRINITY_DN5252_c0_g1_i10:520-825(-)
MSATIIIFRPQDSAAACRCGTNAELGGAAAAAAAAAVAPPSSAFVPHLHAAALSWGLKIIIVALMIATNAPVELPASGCSGGVCALSLRACQHQQEQLCRT